MLRGISKDRTSEYPLSGYKDLKREQTLSDGSELLSFYIPKKYATNIEFESYVQTENQEYVVKELNPDGDFYEVVTKLNLEKFWGKMWKNFENVEATITDTLNLALAGTGWIVGTCEITKKRTIRKTNSSTLDIIKQCLKTYLAEIEYDTLNKVINIYEKRGSDKGKFAMDTVNAKKITLQASSYEYITKLICIGATTTTKDSDGNETSTTLEVTVTNNTYSSKDIEAIWKDERYTIEADLREDGQAKLDELAKPVEAYSVDFAFLDDVKIGDTITLISKENNIFKKLRVVKLTTYPDDPQKSPVAEIGNRIYSFEDMQKQYEDTTSTVSNITADDGSISSSALKDAFNKLVLAELDVATLNALDARIGQLEVTYVTATELVAERANIKNAVIEQLNADDIYAKRAEINVLSSNVANINTLLAGTVTTGSTQTIVLNSQNTTIENALIKSAMIDSLDVSKINAGVISTNKFTIQSNDGAITIADSTMQFKDNNDNVRIQMGQDASGNFSFIIRASDGQTTLIDGTGVKENAIADKLIKTSMINDKAITKDKIDYTSFVEGYNASTNTNTIKASKVLLDGTEQTLDVKFNTMQSTIDNKEASGRNYVRNGDFTQNLNNWNINKNGNSTSNISVGTSTVKGWNYVTFASVVSAGGWAWLCNLNESLEYKKGKKYTVSFYANANNSATTLTVRVNSSNGDYVILPQTTKNIGTEWAKYTITFTNTKGNGLAKNYPLQFGVASGGSVNIAQIKLEVGESASNYCQAYEDISKCIETNTTSISSIQGQISTLITECEQISTNSDNITSLSTKYTQLNQDLTSFKTTVSSTYATQTTVSDLSSTVEQLNNSVTTKVWQSDITSAINLLEVGGTNYVRNGNFSNGLENWAINKDSNSTVTTSIGNSTVKGWKFLTVSTSIADGGWCWLYNTNETIKFVEGNKYTTSFYANSNSGNANVIFRVDNLSGGYTILSNTSKTINSDWAKYTITFTANKSGSASDYPLQFTVENGKSINISQIKLEEGSKATSYTLAQEDIDIRFSSVEQKITSDALTVTISNGLKGTDSIETDKFTFDKDGVHIFNGGLDITNKANIQVFSCDTDGDLVLRGTFTNYDKTTGYLACKIENTQIKFYDFKEDNKLLGSLGSTVKTSDSSNASITLWNEPNSSIIIGWRHAVTKKIIPYFTCEFGSIMKFKQICDFEIPIGVAGINFIKPNADGTIESLTGILQRVTADNSKFLEITNGLKVDEDLTTLGNAIIAGNMTASGSKNCLQQTEHYGGRLFYSLEDCSSYLTDRVDVPVQVEENKQIKIKFNEIFKECVNLTNYQITINKETYGDYTILEKTEDYFILESDTEGFKFTYTITAKRRGYEDRYLDEFKTA